YTTQCSPLSLHDALPIYAVVLVDVESVIQFANPAVEEIFGYKSSELVGQNFSLLLAEGVRGDFREWLRRYLQSDSGRTRQQPARSEEHTSELQSPDHLVC